MKDDVRKYIYTALILFVVVLLAWVSIVYISACGFTLTCKSGALPVARTPVPTLLPATLPANASMDMGMSGQCEVAAADLIGAWVNSGSPETDTFQFTDANGQQCEATFAEVQPLFVEGNLWAKGSYACTHCHSADLPTSAAQLDLTSYAGIKAGSRRTDAASTGTDILGGGTWESSLLFDFLTNAKEVAGHKQAVAAGVFVHAGTPLVVPTATSVPPTNTPEPTVAVTATP